MVPPLWKTVWQFLKMLNKELVTIWSSNSTLRYIHKKNENIHPHKNLYTNVHKSTIHNSQKVQTTQMAINWWMDKQKMVYLYNGILFSHKKEWSTNTCYNMDEPWKHSAKWNKPVTKNRILFESIWTGQNRQIYYSDRKQIRGCLGLGGVRGIRNNCKWAKGFLSRVVEMF